ncbi:MAG: type II toxin-antitoxin system VapC family toxin [Caulobacteraceae bacterium]|nr:type II toxin-antitoxin system VapC family toxin [Caulobacteraceae bacterium]
MRGVDTNVLLRFVLRDDEAQARSAKAAIDHAAAVGDPLLVGLLALLETEWVLRLRAHLTKESVIGVFQQLLETRDLGVESSETLEQALEAYESGPADFADCLINARYQEIGCEAMITFDARAAKLPGARLLAS